MPSLESTTLNETIRYNSKLFILTLKKSNIGLKSQAYNLRTTHLWGNSPLADQKQIHVENKNITAFAINS